MNKLPYTRHIYNLKKNKGIRKTKDFVAHNRIEYPLLKIIIAEECKCGNR